MRICSCRRTTERSERLLYSTGASTRSVEAPAALEADCSRPLPETWPRFALEAAHEGLGGGRPPPPPPTLLPSPLPLASSPSGRLRGRAGNDSKDERARVKAAFNINTSGWNEDASAGIGGRGAGSRNGSGFRGGGDSGGGGGGGERGRTSVTGRQGSGGGGGLMSVGTAF